MSRAWKLFSRRKFDFAFATAYLLCLFVLVGCHPKVSSPEQVQIFDKAGPVASAEEVVGLGGAHHTGPYRVMAGDILEFQMPAVLRVISSELSEWFKPAYGHKDVEPYLARVNDSGKITLPIVGELDVVGKSLAEVEAMVIDAYHPKYVVNSPMVVCQVVKYRMESERVFTVLGLVHKPGAFPYPPEVRYNLMEAIAFAGGLDMNLDPKYLKVFRQNEVGEVVSATFSVDGKSIMDSYAVMIKPGDVVYVDHTLATRFNKLMADILQVRVGTYTRFDD